MSNYDKEPTICFLDEGQVWKKDGIDQELRRLVNEDNRVLTVETYPGVDESLMKRIVDCYNPDLIIETKDLFYDEDTLNNMMQPWLTNDRVRGVMCYGEWQDFMIPEKLEAARKLVSSSHGRILIIGVAASLVSLGDTFIYCDLARWEIQLRYRAGMPNFKAKNENEDSLRKIKRGFFIEWRLSDKLKIRNFDKIDYLIDANKTEDPKMITGSCLRKSLKAVSHRPFRLVPYFDPGVWGGQWMKENFGLDPKQDNYAWSFDGVPEENSLYLQFGNTRIEIPAMDLVLYQPVDLLGPKNYSRFGAEFPIRFDLLDTMGGQNLSLQVHPLTEFIKSSYGMTYTQDESYYLLDAKEDGGVFLGLKEGIQPNKMISDLKEAQVSGSFDASQYVNFFPAKKHDHFLIPAGTVHCSSRNAMVLEISATPYIFTFKLWDWDRLGLDGKPRPIHIEEGEQNIQWDRTTEWVKDNLVNQVQILKQNEDCLMEKTGLHELEFIETLRITTEKPVQMKNRDGFHMLNLVDGKSAIISSPTKAFDDFEVHYAETFILPWAAGDYVIQSNTPGERIKVIQAFVRNR